MYCVFHSIRFKVNKRLVVVRQPFFLLYTLLFLFISFHFKKQPQYSPCATDREQQKQSDPAKWKLLGDKNTKEEEELSTAFGIRSIPSSFLIPMNDKPQMAQGAMPKSAFKDAIENILIKNKQR